MKIAKEPGGGYLIRITDGARVTGHKPSVNVLFSSVAKAAGSAALGVILTGMGDDGAKGLLEMRQAGAETIGQDEETALVYGMPKVAYEIGAVCCQSALMDVPRHMIRYAYRR
jgi:two-component system chemotaxis response regulator CheB